MPLRQTDFSENETFPQFLLVNLYNERRNDCMSEPSFAHSFVTIDYKLTMNTPCDHGSDIGIKVLSSLE